mmetsp:Transcript_2811/g.7558  ORF Transcript_2811/g.7558 Transcript_2811/m.7558 type:complete len:234 (+) Transcript_2811:302-1003(+)
MGLRRTDTRRKPARPPSAAVVDHRLLPRRRGPGRSRGSLAADSSAGCAPACPHLGGRPRRSQGPAHIAWRPPAPGHSSSHGGGGAAEPREVWAPGARSRGSPRTCGGSAGAAPARARFCLRRQVASARPRRGRAAPPPPPLATQRRLPHPQRRRSRSRRSPAIPSHGLPRHRRWPSPRRPPGAARPAGNSGGASSAPVRGPAHAVAPRRPGAGGSRAGSGGARAERMPWRGRP